LGLLSSIGYSRGTFMWIRTAEDVGNVVRDQRKRLGWSQQTLADNVGVSRRWVIGLERGKGRAELALVLRTFIALNLRLDAREPSAAPDVYDQAIELAVQPRGDGGANAVRPRRLPTRAGRVRVPLDTSPPPRPADAPEAEGRAG
jgi:y4mF family transcriptional regulator